MSELDWRLCSTCVAHRQFEIPMCADGHGAECPDRMCPVCGTVVCVGPELPAATDPRAPGTVYSAA